ncbi:MAG: glycosyltransferase family protein [Candidatus Helarchaeota archaeon]
MNIIILTENYEKYKSGYYHIDFIEPLIKRYNCYLYGNGYPKYNKNDDFNDVIKKSPFKRDEIDLIIVSTTWEIQNEKIKNFDPHPKINLSRFETKKVFFLNKEYKKLEKKFEYIKRNQFDLVCTTNLRYKEWEKEIGYKFLYLPFAVNPKRFNFLNLQKIYDFGFTGSLHTKYIDDRLKLKKLIFKNYRIKTNLRASSIFWNNPIKEEFKKYKIYWAEWGTRNIFWKSLIPTMEKYNIFLNKFKTFLNTPSAMGIINTRFFECMIAKTLVLCPESNYYNNLIRNNFNAIFYKKDLSDFIEKLELIIFDESKREKITEQAYNDVLKNHTYENRIQLLFHILNLE